MIDGVFPLAVQLATQNPLLGLSANQISPPSAPVRIAASASVLKKMETNTSTEKFSPSLPFTLLFLYSYCGLHVFIIYYDAYYIFVCARVCVVVVGN